RGCCVTSTAERLCPGCGLAMPRSERPGPRMYYNASPECLLLYSEVLGEEYGNAVLFGQVHQLTVDTYAAQHAGGPHPDKSVAIHLSGLHLMLELGVRPQAVPALLQRLATVVEEWPHFAPPAEVGERTVFDVAIVSSPAAHAEAVRAWACDVWV